MNRDDKNDQTLLELDRTRAQLEEAIEGECARAVERNEALEEVERLKEQLQTTHRQVAEVAATLDPEVVPDAWGLHSAAFKVIRENNAIRAQLAVVQEALRTYRREHDIGYQCTCDACFQADAVLAKESP